MKTMTSEGEVGAMSSNQRMAQKPVHGTNSLPTKATQNNAERYKGKAQPTAFTGEYGSEQCTKVKWNKGMQSGKGMAK